jgi:GxxExxY protein
MKSKEELNELTAQILDSCITVHKEMGLGLFESVYELCLMKELELRSIKAKNQVPVPLFYKGYELSKDFRIDVLVEDEVVIEIKSCERMMPVFEAQIISYLKLADKRVGALVNFNEKLLKNGFKRFVNQF